jgi:peptidoglycan/LPS O-acetylase OafA/YrhL
MNRRSDIDWLRVIAIALLLVYHTAIAFQPWGFMLGFITADKPLPSLWPAMAMLNVWRIPLLFYISGMGVYFASQTRTGKQLLLERARRILVPFLFGIFVIVPLQLALIQGYYHQSITYNPNPAHLWFLGNIFAYVLLLLPVFTVFKTRVHLPAHLQSLLARLGPRLFSTPLILLLVIAAFILEARASAPPIYEMYAFTWHGFFLGGLAFIFGYCFMAAGAPFWDMLLKWRWVSLALAVTLYIHRLLQPQMKVSNPELAIESCCWIFAVLAFGRRYLDRPGPALRYLSQSAYPIYILHMLFLYLACWVVFPLAITGWLKFVLVLALTLTGCFAVYELTIRRIGLLRLLFGLKSNQPAPMTPTQLPAAKAAQLPPAKPDQIKKRSGILSHFRIPV